ncbi:MAG: alkaline phosphatase family protein [Betaproteobacteria bacterium]|nr:MAG: alkaline phosphatase family protein [Betaproteobacteria bacterium]
MLPNYSGGSLVNLVASIVQARGGEPRHPVLAALPAAELSEAENIVLVIIDGLGDRYLARCGAGGELARRRRASITSVFPSTTASAITTSYTGRTPLEHGLTGWFTYFGAAGCVASPLQFRSRGENLPLQGRGFSPVSAFPAPSIFQSIPVRSIVVTAKQIVESDYNLRHCAGAERRAYETLQEFVVQVESAVKSGPERKFIYAYWPHYDVISHRHGSESREAAEQFEKFDRAFGSLISRLSGTQSRIVATADHGFIDVAPEESLELPAELAAMLRFPLCGERRVAYCYVHSPAQFTDRARQWLGDRADVLPSRELLREGWFGPGTPHPRIDERVGDVALVMRGRYTVKDWTPGEPRHLHIGNHGGTSEDEMMIPLIVETT